MKQLLYIALATLIVGCNKGVDEPRSSDNNIGFATQVETKGASITTETISNFGVFGYGTLDKSWNDAQSDAIPDLFDNTEVTRQGDTPPYTWDYSGDVNWNGGLLAKYSFFGYSPRATADNGITAPTEGTKDAPKVSFEALDNVQSQVDLLSAQVTDMGSSENPVLMKFGHALSRIGFKAYSATASIAVTGIEITSVKYKGDLALYNGSWHSQPDTKSFTLTYLTPAALATEAKDEATATDISAGSAVNGYFMLLPQSLTANATAKIIFHYTVGGKIVPAKEYIIKEEWEKGKAITYIVDLTMTVEAPLKVTKVTITDWMDGGRIKDDATGEANEVELKYNDGGTVTSGGTVIQNSDLPVLERPKSPIEAWNTKPDGTGTFYGKGDKIAMVQNITLYNVDNTVIINGLRWLRGNISNDATGVSTGHYAESSPTLYGMLFKWGDMWTYSNETEDDDMTTGAGSTLPNESETEVGYDYTDISGGRASGDPCKLLGDEFMTPTMANYLSLKQSGSKSGTYHGVAGRFFGTKFDECSDTKIADGCIFLPLGRMRDDKGKLGPESISHYWTSTIQTDTRGGCSFYFNSGGTQRWGQPRTYGQYVRCVSMTVKIGGVNWTTSNLEARESQATGHCVAQSPEYFGHYFKWGDKWAYGKDRRNDGMTDRGGDYFYNASNIPANSLTNKKGYDYVGLAGGRASGDPCQMLGKNFKTPTITQYDVLRAVGSKEGTYKGVNGMFIGAKASECTDDKIADKCIFFPNAGRRDGWYSSGGYDEEHNYWTSTIYTDTWYPVDQGRNVICVTLKEHVKQGDGLSMTYRTNALPVRCIRED